MKMVSSSEAAQVLLNNNFAARLITSLRHDGMVYSLAFSPDGRYIVSGSDDNTARVWEAVTGEEVVRLPHDSFLIVVAFSPDGEYVVTKSWDTVVRVGCATGKRLPGCPQ
jgi:WD40 repeat protein